MFCLSCFVVGLVLLCLVFRCAMELKVFLVVYTCGVSWLSDVFFFYLNNKKQYDFCSR